MKIIVDTNKVFSGILNTESRIGKILTYSKNHFQFYTCDFLKIELLKHRSKLLKLTKRTAGELDELEQIVTKNITFINEHLLLRKHILFAEDLLRDIDLNDAPFVALTKQLRGKLWTGDKELQNGLLKKGFKSIITTAELSELLDKLEKK